MHKSAPAEKAAKSQNKIGKWNLSKLDELPEPADSGLATAEPVKGVKKQVKWQDTPAQVIESTPPGTETFESTTVGKDNSAATTSVLSVIGADTQ